MYRAHVQFPRVVHTSSFEVAGEFKSEFQLISDETVNLSLTIQVQLADEGSTGVMLCQLVSCRLEQVFV